MDVTASASDDFSPVSGQVTFNAGETSKTIGVALKSDAVCEDTEHFILQVSGEGANVSGFGEITDVCDIDLDNDNLVDIYTLENLDWMRNDLAGITRTDSQGNVLSAGCATTCNGYELMADLDFDSNADGAHTGADIFYNSGSGWEPVGDDTTPFTSNFNGNDFTLSNLIITRSTEDDMGLFGYVDANDASIVLTGLTIGGSLTSVYGGERVGLFIGRLTPNANGYVTISDIHLNGTIQRERSNYLGSLIGRIHDDNSSANNQVVISNVSFTGEVLDDYSNSYTTGGLIGQVNNIADFQLSGCVVDVALNMHPDNGAGTRNESGGVIGEIKTGENGVAGSASIDDCQVVTSVGDNDRSYYIGGLVGEWDVENASTASISNITSNISIGNITDSGYSFSGLVGRMEVFSGSNLQIDDVHVTGSIVNNADHNTAGLIARLAVEDSYVSISNSSSIADISSVGDYTGGLLGYVDMDGTGQSLTIENSFSKGTVVGDDNVGGLIGGIKFDAATSTLTLNNNFSVSDLTANSEVGNLIGSITNSFNTANFDENYFNTDSLNDAIGTGEGNVPVAAELDDLIGATLSDMKCPQSAGDLACPSTLYSNWSDADWDFGTDSQLPGVISNGLIYRDSDNNGLYD